MREILVQNKKIKKFSKKDKEKTRYYVETREKIKILKDNEVIEALESGTITMIFKKSIK